MKTKKKPGYSAAKGFPHKAEPTTTGYLVCEQGVGLTVRERLNKARPNLYLAHNFIVGGAGCGYFHLEHSWLAATHFRTQKEAREAIRVYLKNYDLLEPPILTIHRFTVAHKVVAMARAGH